MFYIFLLSIAGSIVLAFCCSLTEAALYAVPLAYVKQQAELGTRSGRILQRFKNDMGRPIAAVLILNTIATTAGASVSGWAAAELYGSDALLVFSIVFTLTILYVSEITPKLIGVLYCKQVANVIALPLAFSIAIFSPLIRISEFISRGIKRGKAQRLSLQEFLSMAAIGTEEGALDHFEGSVISNVVGLDQLFVRDVLTPRVVVFRLEETTTLAQIANELADWNFSRVPLYPENDPDYLSSYVIQRDIYRELLRGSRDKTLKELSRPLKTVPELMRCDKLLLQMFEDREQICAVVDEHGSLAGLITLEDIIEEIVGREIVDEYDTVSDLRTFAKILWFTRHRKKGDGLQETVLQSKIPDRRNDT